MLKIFISLFFWTVVFHFEGIAQNSEADSTKHSYVLREFYEGYDTVIVYRRSCDEIDFGHSLVLSRSKRRWKAFTGIEYMKFDENGGGKFDKVKIKRKSLNKKSIEITVEGLFNKGILNLDQDSLNDCKSDPIIQANGNTTYITSLCFHCCGYRFELLTRDTVVIKTYAGERCYELSENQTQKTFIECQEIISEELKFDFDND